MKFNKTNKEIVAIVCIFLVCTLMFAVPSTPASAVPNQMEVVCKEKGLWGIFGGDPAVEITSGDAGTIKPEDLALAEWCDYSYRKQNVKFVTVESQKQYHPDRYNDGKDWTACFGQNNWLVDGFKNPKDDPDDPEFQMKLNPRNSWLLSFQCLCIVGIRDRLDLLRGILSAIMACLISVRTATFADSTLCKELFTTYVCDLIWEIIQWITRGCIGWGENTEGAESNGLVEVFSTTIGAASDAVTSIGDDVASDYGNALASGIFGTSGDNLARAICLWFFGFDFPLTFDTILDATYGQPGQTLVTCDLVKSREYLYSIPGSKKNTIEYNVGCLIRAGCPIADARIELACATQLDEQIHEGVDCSGPDPMGVGDGNKCDCYNVASNVVIPHAVYETLGRIDNRQVNQPSPGPKLLSMPYRYDHAVLKLRLDKSGRQVGGGASGTLGVSKAYSPEDCFPSGHEDGEWWFPLKDKTKVPLGGCSVSPSTGEFFCSTLSDLGLNGSAYIDKVRINEFNVGAGGYGPRLYDGQSLTFAPNIFKDTDDDLCLLVELYDQNGQPIQLDIGGTRSTRAAISVKGQGTHEYPTMLVRSVGSGRTTTQPVPNFRTGVNVIFGSPSAVMPPTSAPADQKQIAIEFIDGGATPSGSMKFFDPYIKPTDTIVIGTARRLVGTQCNNLETDYCRKLPGSQGLRIKHPSSNFEFTIRSVSLTESTTSGTNPVSAVEGTITAPDAATAANTQVVKWDIKYRLLRMLPGKIDCRTGFDDSPTGVVYSTSGQPQMFLTSIYIAPNNVAGTDSNTANLVSCEPNKPAVTKCLCGTVGTCEAGSYCSLGESMYCSDTPQCPSFNVGARTIVNPLENSLQDCVCGDQDGTCTQDKCYPAPNAPPTCNSIPACRSGEDITGEGDGIDPVCDCKLDGVPNVDDFGSHAAESDNKKIKKLVCCGNGYVHENSCPGQVPDCGGMFSGTGGCIEPAMIERFGCTSGTDNMAIGTSCGSPTSMCCKKVCDCGVNEKCDVSGNKCICGDPSSGGKASSDKTVAACLLEPTTYCGTPTSPGCTLPPP
ncbi:hypothetical protein HOB85_00465 [Candidatus Woesearchaeota archaeon]|nr:hypothetical protein [Candidatus Woesearchaeota archaeon]